MNWKGFWSVILGEMPLENFMAYAALMLAGAFLFFAADIRRGAKKTTGGFSWGFMIRDNAIRVLVVLMSIAASVLFYESFFDVPINAKLAFMQGLSIDAVIGTMTKVSKEKGALKRTTDKLKQKYQK